MAEHINYKELVQYQCSYPLKIEWSPSGNTAIVYLIADDERATVATISATTLALWREDIVRALASRPKPAPHQ